MDENFKKKIVEDFGLSNMDSREQERMIEKLGNLLFEAVVERAIGEMDTETMDAFDEVVSTAESDYQKVIGFLREKVAGFDNIVSEELTRLKHATSHIFA